jgi:hypothetical protein
MHHVVKITLAERNGDNSRAVSPVFDRIKSDSIDVASLTQSHIPAARAMVAAAHCIPMRSVMR